MHSLKYDRNLGLSEALTAPLSTFVTSLDWELDLLVPVPLGRRRRKARGYNQAALIAWPMALALGIDYSPRAVARTRDTLTQVGLDAHERRENVRNAFRGDPKLVHGRNILLVDDVATTGATLSSCAEALCQAGARDVFALTVARAYRGPSDDA